ncbi:hypothetical protein XENTR_v10010653 [Xenopus tropicalis]|nr:hypothetical protein XENTR_v10010653 [Xenopus tropicalis]
MCPASIKSFAFALLGSDSLDATSARTLEPTPDPCWKSYQGALVFLLCANHQKRQNGYNGTERWICRVPLSPMESFQNHTLKVSKPERLSCRLRTFGPENSMTFGRQLRFFCTTYKSIL